MTCKWYLAIIPQSREWYLENFETLQDGIIAKYHIQVMLLFVYTRAEKFSVTHKRPLFCYSSKNKRRLLHSQQSFHVQTFSHVLVVLNFSSFVFLFTALTANFCISSPDISGNLAAMFLKVKT